MFVTNTKYKPYPSKSILEDVLSREGLPTAESFTPYNGMAKLLRDQLRDAAGLYSLEEVLAGARDFDVHKARANDDLERDYAAADVTDYYKRLEDIDASYVEQYARNVLIGFNRNTAGKQSIESQLRTYDWMYDEEDDSYVDPTDFQAEEITYSVEDVIEAKHKLPYLLKQLHEGSLEMGGSLISFIIAVEKAYASGVVNIKPMHVISQGAYIMHPNGRLGGKFADGDNSGKVFPRCFAWVCGKSGENNIYYKAYKELMDVLDVLGLSITDEDPTRFDGDFIDRLVCTYVASNEEYVSTYGYIDEKILANLGVDELFNAVKKISFESNDVESDNSVFRVIEGLALAYSSRTFVDDEISYESSAKVQKFLSFWKKWDKSQVSNYMKRLEVYKGLLRENNGAYILIPLRDFYPNDTGSAHGLLTADGMILRFDIRYQDLLAYISVDRFLGGMGGQAIGWETVTF